jgi:HB1, ASXL, restriction endonuclease HTH domain/Restriction endonuclease
MTFTEAALEVLRSAGEPLHYKRITELAIEKNLLSHVGKTPEVTMSSRLAMMVKKDRGQAPIIKVKPGVFAIRESAKQELSPAMLAAIEEVEGTGDAEAAPELAETDADASAAAPVAAAAPEVKPPALPGADVFPEEEGDDDPILAGLEQESEGGDRNGRRRRRRRRRGKGDKSDATAEAMPRAEQPAREADRERDRGERDRDRGRDRGRDRDRDRDASRDGGRESRESMRAQPRERERERDEALDFNRQPAEGDLLGKDLADAVWHVMSRGERVPHPFSRIADLLVRRGRLSGNANALAPTIAAAVRADVARAERSQQRPRFRVRGSRVLLSEWLLPRQLVRSEQDFINASERYGNELRRALIQRLTELPTAGFAELVATWLNAEGITALRAVRRPGSAGNELHFAGTRKTGTEELRLAIVVLRGGRDIDREGVVDVRGALHHYGQATAAWIVTTGRTTSGAREEASAIGAAACALFDGMALAAAMERLGIAVRRHVIAHHEIDYDLLETLGDTPEQRERREREAERERQSARERFSQPPQDRPGRGQPDGGRGQPLSPESEAPAAIARAVIPSSPDWDDEDAPEPHVKRVVEAEEIDAEADEGDFEADEAAEREAEAEIDAEADEGYDLDDNAEAEDAAEDLEEAPDDADESDESEDDLDDEADEARAAAEDADEAEVDEADDDSGDDEDESAERDEDLGDDEHDRVRRSR